MSKGNITKKKTASKASGKIYVQKAVSKKKMRTTSGIVVNLSGSITILKSTTGNQILRTLKISKANKKVGSIAARRSKKKIR